MNRAPLSVSRKRLGRRHVIAAIAAVGALAMVGCGGTSDSTGTATSTSATGDAPSKITIGYQLIPNGDLVVKNKGWLEAALPNTTIEWKAFDSGGAVNEAFAAGSLDIGLAGSSPTSRGLSSEIPYVVPWIHDVIGNAEALAVKKGVTSLADLKGKKVAVPFASTTHYSLLAALKDANIDADSVKIIDSEPADIVAAWTRGDIDAAYIWNPALASLVKDGGTILTDSAQQAAKGHVTYDLAVVSKQFATDYPAAVTAWVHAQNQAVELYRTAPDDFAAAAGAELNLAPDEVLAQAKGLKFLSAEEQTGTDYLGGGLGEDLFSTATFNRDVGEITDVADAAVYASAVDPSFALKVAGGS